MASERSAAEEVRLPPGARPNAKGPRGGILKKATEVKCEACDGTGFPKVRRPPSPRIYPAPCKRCAGKGPSSTWLVITLRTGLDRHAVKNSEIDHMPS
jgi:hypothetical protein